jgi:hypothetical protein
VDKNLVICAYHGDVTGACGIDVACDFFFDETSNDPDWPVTLEDIDEKVSDWRPYDGAGWLLMSFNKDAASKAAYEAFSAKYPIVYQSPVRDNKNYPKGHKFFFAVFDTYKKAEKK